VLYIGILHCSAVVKKINMQSHCVHLRKIKL
jgi:hypothetical protein